MEQLMTVAIVRRLRRARLGRGRTGGPGCGSGLIEALHRRGDDVEVVVDGQDGEPGDYSCARCTQPSPAAGQGRTFETEVAPATASQHLASLMDAQACHELVRVISPYRC